MKEINIKDIKNINIGQIENKEGGTGCTVFVCKNGMPAGLDVRGGGPASRESELLKPVANASMIHALVLSGGSAFGLDAAGGVMACLEDKDIGYDVVCTKVPLVCQACLFDLNIGDVHCRPDKEMGYQATEIALAGGNYQDGNFGAGCAATVGKAAGMETAMKSGIGSYALQVGELQVGAVVAVNALGDIYDTNGNKIAGVVGGDAEEILCSKVERVDNKFTGNTTIGAIITNGAFDKTQLTKIASMAQNGLARAIRPVHTSADGDSVFALSVGDVNGDVDVVGTLAARVMAKAIERAVLSAESAYGYPAAE